MKNRPGLPGVKVLQALAFIGLLLLIVLSIVPGAMRPMTVIPGELEHFVAYGLAGAAFAMAWATTLQRVTSMIGLGFLAVFIEFCQFWMPDRNADLIDAMTGVLGAALGIGLASLISLIVSRINMSVKKSLGDFED